MLHVCCCFPTPFIHFHYLYNNADPDRPKNDKATILADTIQLLKDLTSQVNKLKAEHAMLTEESCEVFFLLLSYLMNNFKRKSLTL